LLQPARQAVSLGNFASALGSIAAHERRFPNGRLAEEREALRVKALRGLGRADDARRAATEFRKQFPRSVLSPQMAEPPTP
jgi:outer membrane protein assembly factor BamD (BamD/ComL family)